MVLPAPAPASRPAPTLPPPLPATPAATPRRRASWGWMLGVVVALGAFWVLGEWLRSSDLREVEVKAWLTTVVLGLAAVQVVTMTVVYRLPKRPIARRLAPVHRWSGRLAVVLIGFVAYLCISAPLPEGFTWHRWFGFTLVALLLAKIVIVRGVPRLSALLPLFGLGVAALLVAQWLTKAMDVLL